MYPPCELPDIKYGSCPLDMRFYPNDGRTLLPMPITEKPPAEVEDKRLLEITYDESIHLFWRCCSGSELFFRQGVTRTTLVAFHQVLKYSTAAALFRALFDLSSCLQRSELDRGPLDNDIVEMYIKTLRKIDDYRLARPSWLVRAQLGDETVYDDIERLCEKYQWSNSKETIQSLQNKDYNWSYVVERKPLSDEIKVQCMGDVSSLTSEINHIIELKMNEGDWLTRGLDSIAVIENK